MKYKHQAYLLTGSNVGDKAAYLKFAINQLNAEVGVVSKLSAIYATEPWGVQNQPTYYNQAIQIHTDLGPNELLRKLKEIEKEAGRQPNSHMQPRVLDIDILLIDNLILVSNQLKIPHRQLENRNFAIIPLAEIAPKLMHPRLDKTILAISESMDDGLAVEKL